MTKAELVKSIAETAGISGASANTALAAVLSSISQAVANGETLILPGFGTFSAKERPARNFRNPKTGETMAAAATTIPHFKPGKTFRELVAPPSK